MNQIEEVISNRMKDKNAINDYFDFHCITMGLKFAFRIKKKEIERYKIFWLYLSGLSPRSKYQQLKVILSNHHPAITVQIDYSKKNRHLVDIIGGE